MLAVVNPNRIRIGRMQRIGCRAPAQEWPRFVNLDGVTGFPELHGGCQSGQAASDDLYLGNDWIPPLNRNRMALATIHSLLQADSPIRSSSTPNPERRMRPSSSR